MLPDGFTKRMQALLGADFDAFAASYDRPRSVGLRLNPLKTDAPPALAQFGLSPVPWAENGFYYDGASRPGLSPYHDAGLYYLQEPSAMAPAGLLDVHPGERVLDLCAAPGGKSTQLAAALRGEGLLVCNEIHPKRARILSGNIERLGIANALVLNEHPKQLAERFPCWFDKILVDAPCSGELSQIGARRPLRCAPAASRRSCTARQRCSAAAAGWSIRPAPSRRRKTREPSARFCTHIPVFILRRSTRRGFRPDAPTGSATPRRVWSTHSASGRTACAARGTMPPS